MQKILSQFSGLARLYRSDEPARRICNAAFVISVLFILGTILIDIVGFLRGAQPAIHRYVSVYMDRSVPEFFGYILELSTAALLLGCYFRFRVRMFVFWVCFFVFAAVDDAFTYHEQMGLFLVETLGLPTLPGLRPRDSGEIIAWGIAAVFLLAPLGWSLLKRAPGTWAVFLLFATLAAALVFFGVMVDMLHEVFRGPLRRIVNWTEDGGELLVLSAAAASALLLYRSDGSALRD